MAARRGATLVRVDVTLVVVLDDAPARSLEVSKEFTSKQTDDVLRRATARLFLAAVAREALGADAPDDGGDRYGLSGVTARVDDERVATAVDVDGALLEPWAASYPARVRYPRRVAVAATVRVDDDERLSPRPRRGRRRRPRRKKEPPAPESPRNRTALKYVESRVALAFTGLGAQMASVERELDYHASRLGSLEGRLSRVGAVRGPASQCFWNGFATMLPGLAGARARQGAVGARARRRRVRDRQRRTHRQRPGQRGARPRRGARARRGARREPGGVPAAGTGAPRGVPRECRPLTAARQALSDELDAAKRKLDAKPDAATLLAMLAGDETALPQRDLDDLAQGLPAIAARLATEAGRRAARAELARADDDATCIVCLSQKRDVVFLTCGHLVVCLFQRPFPGWGNRHRDRRGLREGVRAVSRVPRVRRGQPAARVYAVT